MVPAKQSFSIFYQISCEFGARLKDFGVSGVVLGVWVWVMLQAVT